jgi:hypothetical protein
MKRILDSYGGKTEIFHKDGDKFHIQIVQDVAPYLRQNAQSRGMQKQGWKGDLHEVAAIPAVVIEQWNKELGDNCLKTKHRKFLVAKLNSNEFRDLRTKEGRL